MWSLLLAVGLASATPRVAVTDLANHTGDPSLDGAGPGLAGILVAKLVRVDNLQVVERSQLEAVLAELELGESGVVDAASAAKAGKLLGATHIVTGDLVSVKLPTLAVNLRVIEVETGKVVAATDVVGQIGDHGEEFFVLVDDATFRIVDALQLQLAARDRIELGQVDVQQLATVEAYGRALSALDRGDKAGAEAQLGKALTVEPGFKLGEAALTALVAEVASTRAGYANDAITRAHADWDTLERQVAGTLPANPTVADLALAALRAKLRLARGDLEGYLPLEKARVAATTPEHTAAASKFDEAVRKQVPNTHLLNRFIGTTSVWPWEVRLQMADVLVMLGRKDEASALVVDNYQRPGPTFGPTSRPRDVGDWAERHGLPDLTVVARKHRLTQLQLRGDDEGARRALEKLDDAIEDARAAHEKAAAWTAFLGKLRRYKAADEALTGEERRAMRVLDDDPSLVRAGYAAFQARVKAGFYDGVRKTGTFAEVAEAWRSYADRLYDDGVFVDQRLADLLDLQAAVPARDAADEARRKETLDAFVAGAYEP